MKIQGKRSLKPGNMLNPSAVVMVTCGNGISEYNILTVAWTGTVCSDPPMCCIAVRPERHSHDIIRRNGEFVVNLVNHELAPLADWCGVVSGRDVNKFLETDLMPLRGTVVKAPLIAQSPVNLECKVEQFIPLGSHDLFLARIVAVHADEILFSAKTDALELKRANLVCYSHGCYYDLGAIIGKFGFSVEKKAKVSRRMPRPRSQR